MSEMLNIIVGNLSTKPELTPAFKNRFVLKNYIIAEDDDDEEMEARIPIVAWDEAAQEIAKYKKGEKIHLVCVPNDSLIQFEGSVVSVLGYKVLLVDHDRQISSKINEKILEILKAK